MGVNVVNYGGKTLVDMTNATATAATVLSGYTAYGADGELIVGKATVTAHKTVNVTLYADRWIDNEQTVNVDFATEDAMVFVGGDNSTQSEYIDCEVWCSSQGDRTLTFTCSYTPVEDVVANIGLLLSGDLIITFSSGSDISLNDSSDRKLRGLTIYGKTTQDGTPTPENPVELVSDGDGGSVTVYVGISESDPNPQTLSVSTPNGLPGIPVTSGGNYTDENGQQWVCDEVDFGIGEYVQRIKTKVFNGTESFYRVGTKQFSHQISDCIVSDYQIDDALCSHLDYLATSYASHKNGFVIRNATLIFRLMNLTEDTVASFKAFITEQYENGTPVVLEYILAEENHSPLSAEQLDAYATLHTNRQNTIIYNDAGANMMVRYVVA